MTSKYAGGRRLGAGLVAAIGIVGVTFTPAIAQQAAEEQMEEIVVEAPIVRHQIKRQRGGGGWDEVIELKRRVSFADLDLSKYADVTELKMRIEIIAEEACEKLDEMYPFSGSGKAEVQRCTTKAVRGAEEQKQAAIAAAIAPASGR